MAVIAYLWRFRSWSFRRGGYTVLAANPVYGLPDIVEGIRVSTLRFIHRIISVFYFVARKSPLSGGKMSAYSRGYLTVFPLTHVHVDDR